MRERKFIIGLDQQSHLKLKAGYVLFHRDLIDTVMKGFTKVRDIQPLGGGFWTIKDGEIHLYGSSSDFGQPRLLEEAIKVDGDHLRRQITTEERRIQGNDSIDCSEMPVVYANELGEKIYTEVGQENHELKVEPKESVFPMLPRGSNRTPSTKGAVKRKKAKRRATKKHYGKHK